MKRATIDDVNRMRDIALKFYQGHPQPKREGYQQSGMVNELENLRYKICLTLEGLDWAAPDWPEGEKP